MNRDEDIKIWKNPLLILDYNNFWSRNELFHPYVVKAASAETIRSAEDIKSPFVGI